MAGKGPARTPLRLLELRGSRLARDRARRGEPVLPADTPACPEWVASDPIAAQVWRDVVAALAPAGVLARVDQYALAMFATTAAQWRRCVAVVAQHGPTVVERSREGDERVRPRTEARLALAFAAELRAWGDRLGLTPAARANLSIPTPPPPTDRPKPWIAMPSSRAPSSDAPPTPGA